MEQNFQSKIISYQIDRELNIYHFQRNTMNSLSEGNKLFWDKIKVEVGMIINLLLIRK